MNVKSLIKGKRLEDGSIHLEHPLSCTRPAWTGTHLKTCDDLRTSKHGRYTVIKGYFVKSGGTYHGWK